MKRAACLFALLLAAGCGGSGNGRLSKSQYEGKLRSAFSAASVALVPPAHGQTAIQSFTRLADTYRGIASTLKGIRPPADVQRVNDRLVEGASTEAAGLSDLVSRLRAAPAFERNRILAQYDASNIDGQKEFDGAVAALEAKGYRFRTSGGT